MFEPRFSRFEYYSGGMIAISVSIIASNGNFLTAVIVGVVLAIVTGFIQLIGTKNRRMK